MTETCIGIGVDIPKNAIRIEPLVDDCLDTNKAFILQGLTVDEVVVVSRLGNWRVGIVKLETEAAGPRRPVQVHHEAAETPDIAADMVESCRQDVDVEAAIGERRRKRQRSIVVGRSLRRTAR